MRFAYSCLLGGLVIGSSAPVFCQPPEQSVEFEGNLHTCYVLETGGSRCYAASPIPLYEGLPRPIPLLPFFLLSPDETGVTLQAGTRFDIRDRENVDSVGERSRWVLVYSPDGEELGWSYAGSAHGLSYSELGRQTDER